MKFGHIAVWSQNITRLKHFYVTYFGAEEVSTYHENDYSCVFLKLDDYTHFEIMSMDGIRQRCHDKEVPVIGLTHLAFKAETREEVYRLYSLLSSHNLEFEKPIQETKDGFYEFSVFDPDGNIVEITYKM